MKDTHPLRRKCQVVTLLYGARPYLKAINFEGMDGFSPATAFGQSCRLSKLNTNWNFDYV